jgi:hypothetical protein
MTEPKFKDYFHILKGSSARKEPDPDPEMDPQHSFFYRPISIFRSLLRMVKNIEFDTGVQPSCESSECRDAVIESPITVQSRKLKSRSGARNRFQESSLELSRQAT